MVQTVDSPGAGERIQDVDVASEMQDSYLEYAYSVIYSRAIPDARDGLKPVQRRILFQMTRDGPAPRSRPREVRARRRRCDGPPPPAWRRRDLRRDGPPRPGLRDARAARRRARELRLARRWARRARYTEARLAAAALALTDGLDEDVVEFVPNYDNQLTQPEVLPAAFPNLLVNGATGIAVGMATNMAPHNLIEVIAGARHLLEHPEATLDELMRFIPGPDLPSGGTIIASTASARRTRRDAGRSGRGRRRRSSSTAGAPRSSSRSCPTSSARRR